MTQPAKQVPTSSLLRSVTRHAAGATLTLLALASPLAVGALAERFGSWIQFRQDPKEAHITGLLLLLALVAQPAISALLTSRHEAGIPLVPTQWNTFAVLANLGWFAAWGYFFALTGGIHDSGTRIGFGHNVGILTPLLTCIETSIIICAGAYTARYPHHHRGNRIVAVLLLATPAPTLALLVLTW